MKLILLWLCLISAAFPFPTQSPTDVDNTEVCCDQNPKLIYTGHDSKSGINVYVFEFLPESKDAMDKNYEDTTVKNDLQGNRNALKDKDEENYEDTIIQTNRPVSIHGKTKAPDTETSTRDSTHMPDLRFGTINSAVGAAQNDIAMNEDTGLLSNATDGLQTGTSHARDVQKTSGHSNGDDYYGTEGSALLDIPGYVDTDTGNQSTKVDFPDNVNDLSNRRCSESEGQCEDAHKSKDHIFVTKPTTHKDSSKRRRYGPDGKGNRERNTKEGTVKWSTKQPAKTDTDKRERKTDRNINTKDIPINAQTGKIFQYHRGQRRKIVGNRHRHSSSESSSESSQEFD